jgi:Ca-activated chloride channel family protein
LLTDGENHEGDPLAWMENAKREGLRIFCIGIGTREGELIPITSQGGQKEFLKDKQGHVVKSMLNEELLSMIALKTDGIYVRANGEDSVLKRIYEEILSKMERGEFEGKLRKYYEERFQIPLALALLLLLFEPFIRERKKER